MSCRSLRAVPLVAGLLPGLLACASEGIDVREYVLTSTAAPSASSPAGGRALSVAVGPVILPPYLRRREIVTRVGENEVRASDAHRWGEELGQGLARVVAENLAVLNPTLRVSAFAWRDVSGADYRVSIEVERFEQVADGSIALEANWELLRGSSAVPVATNSATFSEPSAGSDPAAAVDAMSRAAAQLSEAIARFLPSGTGAAVVD